MLSQPLHATTIQVTRQRPLHHRQRMGRGRFGTPIPPPCARVSARDLQHPAVRCRQPPQPRRRGKTWHENRNFVHRGGARKKGRKTQGHLAAVIRLPHPIRGRHRIRRANGENVSSSFRSSPSGSGFRPAGSGPHRRFLLCCLPGLSPGTRLVPVACTGPAWSRNVSGDQRWRGAFRRVFIPAFLRCIPHPPGE